MVSRSLLALERFLLSRPGLVLELFLISNFAFLVLDIYLAHSVNHFKHPTEWIPFWFSGAAALLLGLGLALRRRSPTASRGLGLVVGAVSIAVGIGGVVLHLESHFFSLQTIHALVYTAPFAAPLSYAGLGLLVLLNQMVAPGSEEWSAWVVFLALGGFVGNLALSLCDHAQNGFFHASEWIPVASSALAIGFLAVSLYERGAAFLRLTQLVLVLQVLVGVLGLGLHLVADVNGISDSLRDNFVWGAPVFAPLLFANLALLAGFGVCHLKAATPPAARDPQPELAT